MFPSVFEAPFSSYFVFVSATICDQVAGNEFTQYLTSAMETKLNDVVLSSGNVLLTALALSSAAGPSLNAKKGITHPTALNAAGLAMLGEIRELYHLMCALLKFPDTALYEDERTAVALRLMDYLQKKVCQRILCICPMFGFKGTRHFDCISCTFVFFFSLQPLTVTLFSS
jgi:hypothetical protein